MTKAHISRYFPWRCILAFTLAISIFLIMSGPFMIPSAHATEHVQATPKLRVNSGGDSIVFMHGFTPQAGSLTPVGEVAKLIGGPNDCQNYWHDVMDYLNRDHGDLTWHYKDYRLIQYYRGETNCTNGNETYYGSDLHYKPDAYGIHCGDYPASEGTGADNLGGYNPAYDGTIDESIYHLSCLFAWYMYYNFGQRGWSSVIIAHSMGGLIVHNAIYQVEHRAELQTGDQFPPTLGHITDVVDFSSPHAGLDLSRLGVPDFVCQQVRQCQEMKAGSYFTKEMTGLLAVNSQAGGTDWSLYGSECDEVTDQNSAVALGDVGHKTVYVGVSGGSCYNHNSIIHYQDNPDSEEIADTYESYCNWQDTGGAGPCNVPPRAFPHNYESGCYRSLYDMLHAIWYDTW